MNVVADPLEVRRAVERAWGEVIPQTVFDEHLSWNEAGVDSLKSLVYLFRLEELTGQKISFDLFARDVNARMLIDALSQTSAPIEDLQVEEPRKTLFLFPGIFGDEQRLGNFRRAVQRRIVCETLEVADLSQPILDDIAGTTRILVREIQARQPEGPLALAGYSFGGFLAFQATLELQALGREVELLCLLDTLTASGEARVLPETSIGDPQPRASGGLRGLWRRPGESAYLYFERLALHFCWRVGLLDWARRLVLFSWTHYTISEAQRRRRDLLLTLRLRGMRRWRPQPCSAPTLLIASDDCINSQSKQVWEALCQNITVQYVGGDHGGLFDPEQLTLLLPPLFKALKLPTEPQSESSFDRGSG